MAAGIALSAEHLRFNGHLLTDSQAGHVFTDFHDFTGYLMTLGHGIGGERMRAVEHMNVTAADADHFDLHLHLPRQNLRNRHRPKAHLMRRIHYFLNHFLFHK